MVTLSATGGPATAALPIIAPQLHADGAATLGVQHSQSPTAAAQQLSDAASVPPMHAAGRVPGRSAGAAAAEEALGRLSLLDQPKGSQQAQSRNSSSQDVLVSKEAEKPVTAQAVPSQPVLASSQQQQQQQPGSSSTSIDDPLRSSPRPFAQPDSGDGLHDDSKAAPEQHIVPQQGPQSPAEVRLLLSAHSGALPPCIAVPNTSYYILIRFEPFLGRGQWTVRPKL